METEELASIVMNALTLHKENLRNEGVFDISSMGMGQEVALRKDVSDIYTVVPIELNFTMQTIIAQKQKFYPLRVKYIATHKPEVSDPTPNPVWDISNKSWFEPTKDLTLGVTLEETVDYEITTSGLLSFTNAPVPTYYIVAGQTSTTGPNDGTEPYFGSSDYNLSPGFLPSGTLTWEVWYTRADTLEATTTTLTTDGETTEFTLAGGIYGYANLFNTFTLNQNTVSGEVGWHSLDD